MRVRSLALLLSLLSLGSAFFTSAPRTSRPVVSLLWMRSQGNKRRRENRAAAASDLAKDVVGPAGTPAAVASSNLSPTPLRQFHSSAAATKPFITQPLRRLSFDPSRSSPAVFVQALRDRAQADDAAFDRDERQQLAQALEHWVPKLDKSEFVSVVTSLGTCSHKNKQWYSPAGGGDRLSGLLQTNLRRVARGFAPYELASVLVAAARMEWKWGVAFGSADGGGGGGGGARGREGFGAAAEEDEEERGGGGGGGEGGSLYPSLLRRLLSDPEGVQDQTVSDILWGLGSLGLRLQDLGEGGNRRALLRAFEVKAQRMNGYELSSSLWALAKMGARWDADLSAAVREALPARLLELASSDKSLSPQQSSKVIWSLGTCGLRFSAAASDPSLAAASPSNSGALLPLLERLLTSISSIKRSKMGGAVPASQTLVGLAKLGVPWVALSPSAQDEVYEQVVRVCQSTNDRGITNAVWALGTLGVPVQAVPPEVKAIMLTGVTRAAADCTAWALCNIVWGLAKMRWDWLSLPVAFRETLMETVSRVEPDMNSQDAAILIWSLGSIDTPLDALPPFFTDKLLRACVRTMDSMKPEELTRTIWGLSSAELSWDALPPAVRWNLNVNLRRVGNAMAPQDVANCAYGLAILAFDTKEPSDPAFRGAHEVLLNTIINNRDKILARLRDDPSCAMQGQELEQLRIYSHYLASMRFVSDVRRIPREFLEGGGAVAAAAAAAVARDGGGGGGGGGLGAWASSWQSGFASQSSPPPSSPTPPASASASRLQSRVTKGLVDGLAAAARASPDGERLGLEVRLEVSSFGGVFPVDAGIISVSRDGGGGGGGDKFLALVEIDGPHHYRPCDGRLRRKDRLKEAMYRKALPDCAFHRVRWDDANKVGSDIVGEELAGLVLSSAQALEKGGPLAGFFRGLTRDAANFFAWGLRNES